MCAINGFNFKDENLILKMNKITSHRGPDGAGVFCDNGISLGHNRLSIIDLSDAASQPMTSFDGKLIIVFNGEIYNYQELKNELGDYPFKTNSDTEVILVAFRKWGGECVKKFNGIFAFAIWDKEKKELFIARDHIGVKPLYYFLKNDIFIFSSEIKAILEHNIPRILNMEAFNHYLRVLYVPEPFTMFEGVRKFPPASSGLFKDGELVINKYWEPQRGVYDKRSKREIEQTIRDKVFKSLNKQLVSDRPVGIYLSGGIDSTVVLDNVSRIRGNIDTFSVGFDLKEEEEREKFNYDFNLAKMTAKCYGANHHEILLSSKDAADYLEKVVWHMDEPIANPTALAMMKLANFAKGDIDVALGGDGGDELFGGYERYRLSLASSYYHKLPFLFKKVLGAGSRFKKLDTPPGVDRFALFMFQKDNVLSEVVNRVFFEDNSSVKKFFAEKYFKGFSLFKTFEERFMDTDRQSWLVDESLMMTDKMSMSAGLETRVPLLDKDLVEYALSIPLQYKVNLFDTKIVFKEAFKDKIPKFILKQPKRGWFAPGAKWLRNPDVLKMAREILSEGFYENTGRLFNYSKISGILDDHVNGKKYNFNIIWTILTFQIWAKRYKIKIR